jgi:hypothetical protein
MASQKHLGICLVAISILLFTLLGLEVFNATLFTPLMLKPKLKHASAGSMLYSLQHSIYDIYLYSRVTKKIATTKPYDLMKLSK